MATMVDESSSLLPHHHSGAAASKSPTSRSSPANRVQRSVTFNPLTTVSTNSGSSAPGPSLRPMQTPSSALAPGQNPAAQNGASTGREPMLSAFNSKLRRRNSAGAPLPTSRPITPQLPRAGAQRTTKTTQKLKLLPNPETDDGADEESGRDVYSQFTRIKDPTARRDAARLGKADRDRLPRVTAYCVAQGYRLEGVMKFMKARAKTRGANPKLFDECLYSPYNYDYVKKVEEEEAEALRRRTERQAERRSSKMSHTGQDADRSPVEERIAQLMGSPRPGNSDRRYSDSAVEVDDHMRARREDLIDLQEELGQPVIDTEALVGFDANEAVIEPMMSHSSIDLVSHREQDELHQRSEPDIMTIVDTPEVFMFDYGTLVIWGMTTAQEQKFLNDMTKFSEAPLPTESVQAEEFNFYYTQEYQARIYNDFISLRDPKNYMTKLAISHALAQSAKTSLFEELVSETIETTSPLPAMIAQTGSVNLTARQLNMQVGELFILRINIHLQGSVLDSPELMWAEPHLEPVYAAVRSYLEIGQRVELLNDRLDVIADLLAVLREQGSRRHGEVLEWIVIVLIAAEIIVAAVNIVVDLVAGVE